MTARLIDALELDSKDIWNNVAQYSRFPWERCGLVYGDLLLEIPNVHENPSKNFSMDRHKLEQAINERGEPDAYWHSHPSGDPRPSENDLRCASDAELTMVILTVDAVTVWEWESGSPIATIRSPYRNGK